MNTPEQLSQNSKGKQAQPQKNSSQQDFAELKTTAELKASEVSSLYNPNKTYRFPIEQLVEKIGFSLFIFQPRTQNDVLAGIIDCEEKRIYVNSRDNGKRQLFTVAHELGHYFLQHSGIKYRKDTKDTISASAGKRGVVDPEEFQANAFAAALLMPEDVFKKIYKKHEQDFEYLSWYFGVSTSAIAIRAKNLTLFKLDDHHFPY